jgi:hypothetical protein
MERLFIRQATLFNRDILYAENEKGGLDARLPNEFILKTYQME